MKRYKARLVALDDDGFSSTMMDLIDMDDPMATHGIPCVPGQFEIDEIVTDDDIVLERPMQPEGEMPYFVAFRRDRTNSVSKPRSYAITYPLF